MYYTVKAFILGWLEFRQHVTTNPGDDYIEAYDWGRELRHRLNLRRCESWWY